MLFENLKLTNLLSFGPDSSPLELASGLNVLIGPNGSGKSNVIDAFELFHATPVDLSKPFQQGGGISEWLWKGIAKRPRPTATIETVVGYPSHPSIRYRLSFTEIAQRIEVTDERIEDHHSKRGLSKPYFYFGYENKRPMFNIQGKEKRELRREDVNPEQSILSQRKDPDHYPEVAHIDSTFSSIQIFRNLDCGRHSLIRRPQSADLKNDFLSSDASNLGLILNRLRKEPATKTALQEHLREAIDRAQDVEVYVEGNTVQIFLQENGWSIPATRLSDGTLRWLCLLAVLLHPTPPGLVCIEEPETALHPDLIPKLASLLREASSRMQLIVTTHSDTLVDALTDTPEAIIVCEKGGGATTLKRLNQGELKTWLEKYNSLGQLWRSGEIGGNRW